MAPKRKHVEPSTVASKRAVTRSMTKRPTRSCVSASSAASPSLPQQPRRKKLKRTPKAEASSAVDTEPEAEKEEEAVEEKNLEAEGGDEEKEQEQEASAVDKKGKGVAADADGAVSAKTVIIERCNQCTQFKTRAIEVKEGLEAGVAGIKVLINPKQPRKGFFEIREEGGEIFVTTQDKKRPFTNLRALDLPKVISDIIEKIK